jgi:hypothetical protein
VASLVVSLVAGCTATASSVDGGTGTADNRAAALGRAPLSQPWSQVKIVGGSPRQHAALRGILRGFGWTAIRTISIASPPADVRGRGTGFAYTIAVPEQAKSRGVLGFQGEWEAEMVGENYAALQAHDRLPRLAYQAFSNVLPDGTVIRLSGGVGTAYGGRSQRLPNEHAVTTRVHQAATEAGLTLRYLGFVHPYRTLPIILVTIRGHDHLRERLEGFFGHVLPPQINLAYVELDTTCGRPVFARGQGIALDPAWFDICDFTVGCPTTIGGNRPPRPTYPC